VRRGNGKDNMRSFIVALSILVVILCWLVGSYIVLNNLSISNVQNMQLVYSLIYSQEWDLALSEFEMEKEEFDKKEWIYSALVDHAEMDTIEISLIATEAFIKTQSPQDALDSSARAIFLFEHIESKNRFNWENVL